MSIVGTRPPLIGEVSEYELHHRARLAIKPGITGREYIKNKLGEGYRLPSTCESENRQFAKGHSVLEGHAKVLHCGQSRQFR